MQRGNQVLLLEVCMAKIIFNDKSVDEDKVGDFQRETGRSPDTEPTSKSYGNCGKDEYKPDPAPPEPPKYEPPKE